MFTVTLERLPVTQIHCSKIVIGVAIGRFADERRNLLGMKHESIADQPVFVLNTREKYKLLFIITFHRDMESIVKKVKNVSVKLRNFEDHKLKTENSDAARNKGYLEADAILDPGDERIRKLISFNEDIDEKPKVLDLTVNIEANPEHKGTASPRDEGSSAQTPPHTENPKCPTFNVGVKVHYMTPDHVNESKPFQREVKKEWEESIHKKQDFKHSVLVCGFPMR